MGRQLLRNEVDLVTATHGTGTQCDASAALKNHSIVYTTLVMALLNSNVVDLVIWKSLGSLAKESSPSRGQNGRALDVDPASLMTENLKRSRRAGLFLSTVNASGFRLASKQPVSRSALQTQSRPADAAAILPPQHNGRNCYRTVT